MSETSLAKLLHEAQNAAGARAEAAAKDSDYLLSREWKRIAIEIAGLMRDAIELMARAG